MSYKPDESTWMSYLYGELSEAERKQVEEYLKNDESAKAELEAFKNTSSLLGKIKDQEIEVPTFSFSSTSEVVIADSTSQGKNSFWHYALGMAASLALLLVVGYLTSFRASVNNEGLRLYFGQGSAKSVAEETYSRQEVEALIALAIDENNQQTSAKISEVRSESRKAISSLNKSEVEQQLLDEYLVKLRSLNTQLVGEMMEDAVWEQRKYTDRVIQDLAIYLDLQRQEDMNVIQTQFQNLSEDTESTRRQTNQILSTFLTQDQEPQNQY